MINDVGAPSAGTSSTTDVLSAEGVCLRSTQDVTIGFTLLHAGKQKDRPGPSIGRGAFAAGHPVTPQTPVQAVN